MLDGLIDTFNIDRKILIVASGTAVSQSREAIRLLENQGIEVGLIKIKTIRPFPTEELQEATANAHHIFVPEFNIAGWLAKEIKAVLDNNKRVYAGPHVAGGMTLPSEVIVDEIKKHLGMKVASVLAVAGAIVGEFIASDKGLGNFLLVQQNSLNTPAMVMALVIISLIGMLLYGVVILLEYFFITRKGISNE